MIVSTSRHLRVDRALQPRFGVAASLVSSTVNPVTPTFIPHALDSTITGLTFPFGPYRGLIANARASTHRASSKMVATKIDGTAIAKKIKEQLSAVVTKSKAAEPTFNPSLTILQGVRMKKKISSRVSRSLGLKLMAHVPKWEVRMTRVRSTSADIDRA